MPGFTTLSRQAALDHGILVDCSEMARSMGFHWPLAISQGLEEKILEHMPAFGTNVTGLANSVTAATQSVLVETLEKLAAAGQDPKAASLNEMPFEMAASWRQGLVLKLVLLVLPDDAGQPCFTLILQDEQPDEE